MIRIHSVILDTGMVSVNRQIPVGLRIRWLKYIQGGAIIIIISCQYLERTYSLNSADINESFRKLKLHIRI